MELAYPSKRRNFGLLQQMQKNKRDQLDVLKEALNVKMKFNKNEKRKRFFYKYHNFLARNS